MAEYKSQGPYGIAGLDGDPNPNGKIENISEVASFLEGFSDKDKLKDILDNLTPGGGGTPAPNSVGSEQIKDGSIQTEDLDSEVQEGLHELDNEEVYANNEAVEDLFK